MNINYLALKLPGDAEIGQGFNNPRVTDLGSLTSGILGIFFYIAGFVLVSWLSWGIFQYILAGGNKEALAKARARITYALVGFLILILSFALSEYAQGILEPNKELPVQKINETMQNFELIKTVEAASFNIGDNYAFGNIPSLGVGFNHLIIPAFSLAATAVVIYFLIGAFKWLASGGDKNAIASARGMITHAIIGFILLIMMFFVIQFLPQLLGIGDFRIIR